MSKYTAEQVFWRSEDVKYSSKTDHRLTPACADAVYDMLRDYAALLRERKSAKAAVTDEITRVAFASFNEALFKGSYGPDDGKVPTLDYPQAMRAALEAVAPMLASVFLLPHQFVDRVTTDGVEEPPCMGAGVVNDLQELANEVEACWLCASNGDGEITLETINNWSGRLSKMASARVPDAMCGTNAPSWVQKLSDPATYAAGWNACREAMLAAAPKPETEE